jgi:hypothetical protein
VGRGLAVSVAPAFVGGVAQCVLLVGLVGPTGLAARPVGPIVTGSVGPVIPVTAVHLSLYPASGVPRLYPDCQTRTPCPDLGRDLLSLYPASGD